MNSTPSGFVQLNSLSENEIYSHSETKYACSWSGYIDKLSESDIKHLEAGKPLMLVVSDEYICILQKEKH